MFKRFRSITFEAQFGVSTHFRPLVLNIDLCPLYVPENVKLSVEAVVARPSKPRKFHPQLTRPGIKMPKAPRNNQGSDLCANRNKRSCNTS